MKYPAIIGYAQTKFGELWDKSLTDLITQSIWAALKQTELEPSQIDAIYVSNMLGGILEYNLHLNARVAERIGVHCPVYRVEAACASGGMALQLAHQYVWANKNKTVLVVGGEKMTDVSNCVITDALSSAAAGEEHGAGLTFPGIYGLMAQYYLSEYNYSEKHLASVAVKNHKHALDNEYAQYRKAITMEQVLNSPYVATPLKVLDSSPISDGAATLVVTSNESLVAKSKKSVSIMSCAIATDSVSLKGRKSIDTLEATVLAGNQAFSEAGLTRSEISVAEVHDCFTIAELLAMEDLGFYKKGEAGAALLAGVTTLEANNKLAVNTSGGLKAAGHPIGATGVKQVGEIFLQLSNACGNRQKKDATFGLAHNVGGSGGTAVVTILGQLK